MPQLNRQSYAIIPGYTVNYEVNIETPLPPGKYTAISKINLQEDGNCYLDTEDYHF